MNNEELEKHIDEVLEKLTPEDVVKIFEDIGCELEDIVDWDDQREHKDFIRGKTDEVGEAKKKKQRKKKKKLANNYIIERRYVGKIPDGQSFMTKYFYHREWKSPYGASSFNTLEDTIHEYRKYMRHSFDKEYEYRVRDLNTDEIVQKGPIDVV